MPVSGKSLKSFNDFDDYNGFDDFSDYGKRLPYSQTSGIILQTANLGSLDDWQQMIPVKIVQVVELVQRL